MPVTEISSAADLAAALKANKTKLVVVDFYATWCGPCKAIAPHVETLSGRYAKEASFYKVDVDKVPDVAKDAGVQAMPSFGFYGDGKMVELMKGADPRGLEEKVKKYGAQFFKSPFTSAGYSLSGSRPASAAATAPTTATSAAANGSAAAAGGNQPARRNPWADPSFFPGKKSASTPATAAAPTAASTSTSHSTSSTIPAGSKLLNPTAASSSSSTPSASSAASSTAPADNTSAASAASASAATSATPSTTSAPSAAASSHPALQVNPELLQQLRDMGFTDVRAQKALLFTGNKEPEDALNWLVEHQDDADIDEPLQVVGVEKKEKESGGLPAGVNIDDLDEDAQVLYADMMKRKAKEQAAASSTSAASKSSAAAVSVTASSGKKAVSDMSSEEKRQWLEERKAAVKAKKEAEALEKVKSDYKSSKGMTHAMNELKEQREEFERQQAIARKKKEEADRMKHRREIQEKIAADKERRRVEQEKTLAAIQKAKEEKASGGK